jgi:hypothetical protein
MTKAVGQILGVGFGAVSLAMIAGCGGVSGGRRAMAPESSSSSGAAYDAPAQAGYSGAAPQAEPESASGSTASADVAPAPPMTAAPSPTFEPAPKTRPGLGTEWGEARESHIVDVSFLRDDPVAPFAQAQLYYNDWQGVQALAAYHGGQRFHEYGAAGGAITVSIRGDGGDALDAMNVGDRTYVIGQQGERYSIVIANHTARTFEAVATVDGLDVMNGEPGSYDNRGYVVGPYGNLSIDGFRQSHEAVASFRFAKVADSYAAQRGSARNVGVIGVAFFAQRGDDWSRASNRADLRLRDTASPFPADTSGRFAPPPWR